MLYFLKSYFICFIYIDNRNILYLINLWFCNLVELTLRSLVSFGQLRFWALPVELRVGTGEAGRDAYLGEELGALLGELDEVVELVNRLWNQIFVRLEVQHGLT